MYDSCKHCKQYLDDQEGYATEWLQSTSYALKNENLITEISLVPSALDQCSDPAVSRIWYGTDAYVIDPGQQRLLQDEEA